MNGSEPSKPTVGAALSKNGTPSRVNKSVRGRLRLQSPLTKQFKSPLSRNSRQAAELSEAELQQQIDSLQTKIHDADREIEELKAGGYEESELQTHIDKLHEYNEVKDVGQMVLGRIAVLEGVQTKDLYPRYGLDLKD